MSFSGRGKSKKGRVAAGGSFYWQFYGFTKDPFSAIRDEQMYYSFPQWEDHVDLLQHLVKNKNALLAVIGGEGSGKSTLANHFQQLMSETLHVHHFAADALFSTRKLVLELSRGFNLKTPPSGRPEVQLDAQVAEIQYSAKLCLLIIDDAHFLPIEALNSLLFLLKQQSEDQMRLHVLLFGDKNLQTKLTNLAKHGLMDDVIHALELKPVTLEETKAYLRYRLAEAGLVKDFPLSQMQLEQIFLQAEGMPARINRLAQQALLDALMKQQAQKPQHYVYQHQTKLIGGALLVVALASASYFISRGDNFYMEKPKPTYYAQSADVAFESTTGSTAQQNAAGTNLASWPEQATQDVADRMEAVPVFYAEVTQPHALLPINPRPTQSKMLAQLSSAIAVGSEKSQVAPPPEVAAFTTTAPKAVQLAAADNQKMMPVNDLQAQADQDEAWTDNEEMPKTPITPTAQTTQPVTTSAPQPQPSRTPKIARAVLAPSTIAPATAFVVHHARSRHPAVVRPAAARSVQAHSLARNQAKAQANKYTIQIVGLSHKAAMEGFIRSHKIQKEGAFYKSTLRGKPFYILTYGAYPNRNAATKAIQGLPEALRSFKPYMRTFASVQKDMQNTG